MGTWKWVGEGEEGVRRGEGEEERESEEEVEKGHHHSSFQNVISLRQILYVTCLRIQLMVT